MIAHDATRDYLKFTDQLLSPQACWRLEHKALPPDDPPTAIVRLELPRGTASPSDSGRDLQWE
jgi:hypothetical protein